MSTEEILDIVNENDEVIGQGTRKEIHEKGLLHRVVDIWFYNKKGQVLLQKRSLKKDNSPGLLGFSVGGHVEAGASILDTVLREAKEETGLDLLESDLIFLGKEWYSGTTENQIKSIFAYNFTGKKEDLVFDIDEVEYFEWWNIEDIFHLSSDHEKMFGKIIFHKGVLQTLQKILEFSKP